MGVFIELYMTYELISYKIDLISHLQVYSKNVAFLVPQNFLPAAALQNLFSRKVCFLIKKSKPPIKNNKLNSSTLYTLFPTPPH